MSGDAFKLGQYLFFNLKLIKSYLFVNRLQIVSDSIVEEPTLKENADDKVQDQDDSKPADENTEVKPEKDENAEKPAQDSPVSHILGLLNEPKSGDDFKTSVLLILTSR